MQIENRTCRAIQIEQATIRVDDENAVAHPFYDRGSAGELALDMAAVPSALAEDGRDPEADDQPQDRGLNDLADFQRTAPFCPKAVWNRQ